MEIYIIHIVADDHVPAGLHDVAPLNHFIIISTTVTQLTQQSCDVRKLCINALMPAVYILTSRWHTSLHTGPLKTLHHASPIIWSCQSALTGRLLASLIKCRQVLRRVTHYLARQTVLLSAVKAH